MSSAKNLLNGLKSIAAIYRIVLLQNVKFFLRFSLCIQFFNKIILLLNMIGDETFNIMLTSNVVSFEQLCPGR